MFLKIFIFGLCFVPYFMFAQGIRFYEGSFENLKEEAKKQNKIIFIDCYTSWCGPCKWMSKNVFPDSLVGEFYNSHFINYKLDMEKGEGKDVKKQYTVNSYPTFLFLNGDGEIEHRSPGACDTASFIKLGKTALDREDNYGTLLRRYNSGDRTPDFLAKYALTCANILLPYDINEYFATQKDSDLISEQNFVIMERYLTDIKSREFLFLIKNREKFSDLLGRDRVDNRIVEIFRMNSYLFPNNKKSEPIFEAINEMIDFYNLSDSDLIKMKVLLGYYTKSKYHDWYEYGKYSSFYINSLGIDKIGETLLFEIMSKLAVNSDDTVYLNLVNNLCDSLIARQYEVADSYYYKAVLYFKFKDKENSKLYAEKALSEEKKKTVPNIKKVEDLLLEISNDNQKK